jgi:hypothetical protein
MIAEPDLMDSKRNTTLKLGQIKKEKSKKISNGDGEQIYFFCEKNILFLLVTCIAII